MASYEHGSEAATDEPCAPCSRDRREIDAMSYCTDCREFLCKTCVGLHKRFATMTDHVMLDKSVMAQCIPMDRVTVVNLDLGDGSWSSPSRRQITGICCVSRGTELFTVISDWYSKRIAVLNSSFSVVCVVQCRNKMYSICELPLHNRLVATCRDTGVVVFYRLLNDGKLVEDGYSDGAPETCRGIAAFSETFTDGFITVSGGTASKDNDQGRLTIFTTRANTASMKLEVIILLCKKTQSERAKNVAINAAKSHVYFTDSEIGIIAIATSDRQLNTRTIINTPLIKGARGICIGDDDVIYVSGTLSNNVVKFAADGTLIGEVLNATHGINFPITLCFDSKRKWLLVGCRDVTKPFIVARL